MVQGSLPKSEAIRQLDTRLHKAFGVYPKMVRRGNSVQLLDIRILLHSKFLHWCAIELCQKGTKNNKILISVPNSN